MSNIIQFPPIGLTQKTYFRSHRELIVDVFNDKDWKELTGLTYLSNIVGVNGSTIRELKEIKSDGRVQYRSRFFSGPVCANLILKHWAEFCEIAPRYYKYTDEGLTDILLGGILVRAATTSTFKSVAGNNFPIDGFIANAGGSNAFSTRRSGNGTSPNATGTVISVRVEASTTTNEYVRFDRSLTAHDTATLPDTDTIDSAGYEFTSSAVVDTFTESASISIAEGFIADAEKDALAASDYEGNLAPATKIASDLALGSVNIDGTTYNVMALTDLTVINKIAPTIVTGQIDFDMDNTEPTWGSGALARLVAGAADDSAAVAPQLVVLHTSVAGGVGALINGGLVDNSLTTGRLV